ncbi:alpha-ribazole phosphatase [uncultured Phascolarctobacterium sp.]|uniref:alpha-ribazole phosphatase n=1 Tax=Phascolarctobacterium sp. TaxID=2049039 RepID=UPI0025CB7C82|nr:alpha-ribazole phosphatase [uncultured Phascolarctobacterium sp.]
MGKIYLIRHGETDANRTFQFQGHIDNPLNSKGLRQAAALGKYYENIELDAVYSSSMQRARQTATPLAQFHGVDLQPLDELKEVSFGDWEGLSYDEIKAKWGDQLELFFKQPAQCRMPGGESFDDVAKRVQAAYNMIIEANSGKNIAIVSHGGVVRVQLCLLLGLDINKLWMFGVHNASTTCIGRWQDRFTIEYVNDTHYLHDHVNSDGIKFPK